MASVNVTNWQAQLRTAGALMNLQATPMVPASTSIDANPKKAQGNVVSSNDRAFLPQWPTKSVYRIREQSSVVTTATPLINKLELETTSIGNNGSVNGLGASIALIDSGVAYETGSGFKYDDVWTGGDNLVYEDVTFYHNEYSPLDLDNDGILEDYWTVTTRVWSMDSAGAWQLISSSQATLQTSPITTGTACAYNNTNPYGGFFSVAQNSLYGVFTNVIYAKAWVDKYITTTFAHGQGKFCLRKSADSSHGLSAYAKYAAAPYPGVLLTSDAYAPFYNTIFSARESTSQIPVGRNNLHDTSCRWYYTPTTACEDCWYAGKTLTVEITYKEAPISRSYTFIPEEGIDDSNITYTLGSWATHSTVTQTLVLPSGFTRQAINAAFDVPTKNGYVVAIDDIKLVSVT